MNQLSSDFLLSVPVQKICRSIEQEWNETPSEVETAAKQLTSSLYKILKTKNWESPETDDLWKTLVEGTTHDSEKLVDHSSSTLSSLFSEEELDYLLSEISKKSNLTKDATGELASGLSEQWRYHLGQYIKNQALSKNDFGKMITGETLVNNPSSESSEKTNLEETKAHAEAPPKHTQESEKEAKAQKTSASWHKIIPFVVVFVLSFIALAMLRVYDESHPPAPKDRVQTEIQTPHIPLGVQEQTTYLSPAPHTTPENKILLPNGDLIPKDYSPVFAFLVDAVEHGDSLPLAIPFEEIKYTSGDGLQLTDRSNYLLDHLASVLFAYPSIHLGVQYQVSDSSNSPLAIGRTAAVIEKITEQGVSSDRLQPFIPGHADHDHIVLHILSQ